MSRFRSNRRRWWAGSAAVEFAIVAPFIIMFFAGAAETVSYLRIWYRLEQAAASAASAGARAETLNTAAVAGLFEAARVVAAPHSAWSLAGGPGRARTVVSVVSNPTNGNVVSWTCSRGDSSLVSKVAGTATLPAAMTVPRGQSVLVVEIMNSSTPWMIMSASWLMNTRGPPLVRTHVIVRPRSAELSTLTGGCP